MLAKDVMTAQVISVSSDTEVIDIAKLLIDKRISAVPVVDAEGHVLGIVSEGDLVRRVESGTEKKRGSWWLSLFAVPERLAGEYAKAHGQRASDVMTRDVVTVSDDTPLGEIAQVLEENHIKRVPVVHEDRLVGIVSRANLLHGLVAAHRHTPPPAVSANDSAIREQVMETLRNQPWSQIAFTNVTVENGIAHLWGMVDSRDQITASEVAAREVPGVKSVENHLNVIGRNFYYGE
jgi:CBS domain-containing protein